METNVAIVSFSKLITRWHPDKNPNDLEAASRYKLLATIKDFLEDDDKRTAYDYYVYNKSELGDITFDQYFEAFSNMPSRVKGLYRKVRPGTLRLLTLPLRLLFYVVIFSVALIAVGIQVIISLISVFYTLGYTLFRAMLFKA